MTNGIAKARFKTSQLERADGPGLNSSDNVTMGEIIATRFSRRMFLRGSLATSAIAATVGPAALLAAREAKAQVPTRFDFTEVEAGVDETHHVAEGHDADVLLRWGDPPFAGAPEFDPTAQTAEKQRQQFGYNNDYFGFIPIEGSATHGLLVVNHEYTNEHLMFPGIVILAEVPDEDNPGQIVRELQIAPADRDRVDVEMAAHGGTIVEIRRGGDGKWQVVRDGRMNRRITADTEMEISGPAAGHPRLQTNADPTGRRVRGTVNNCAGGVTPWGTYVMAEENLHGYFDGELPEGHREEENYEGYGVPEGTYAWAKFYDRFDLSKEPNEPNRFGWVVGVDPMDPTSTPKKRTALRRTKHEGAENVLAPDGRVVFYLGDDERFDSVYKFVTAGRYSPDDRTANWTTARSTSRASMRTAAWNGSRWFGGRVR